MRELLHISKNNQLATLLLGIVIAVFSIVAPHYSNVQLNYIAVEEVESDIQGSQEVDHSKENPVKEQIVKAIDAVPNVLQISFPGIVSANLPEFSVDFHQFLIEKTQKTVLSASKYFKILFRQIISPNAP